MQWVFLRNKQEHIAQRMIFLTAKTLQLRLTLTELANEQARTPQMRQQFQVPGGFHPASILALFSSMD